MYSVEWPLVPAISGPTPTIFWLLPFFGLATCPGGMVAGVGRLLGSWLLGSWLLGSRLLGSWAAAGGTAAGVGRRQRLSGCA